MIPLDRLKTIKAGELVIYEAPSENGLFYSGRVLRQPKGITKPLYLRLIPSDSRLKPIKLVIPGEYESKPLHFVRELAFNWGVAFRVSEEDLRGSRDLSQDLVAQTEGTDNYTKTAATRLIAQLPEVRRNFIPLEN